MNRLKSGEILAVPDSDAVRGIGEGEAHGMVVAHAADFNAYRNKLAGQVAASEPVKVPPAGQSAGGKITAKVEERPTAANEAPDQLRLSKAVPAHAGAKGATVTAEDMLAKEKALADAQARVKELEKNVNELEKLVTVKNRAGAEALATAQQNAQKPAPAKSEAKPVAKLAPKPVVAKPPVKAKAAPPAPGLVDTLKDNITYIGAGALVLLLAALGISRRRKKEDEELATPEPSLLGVPTEHTHSLFAETGGQSVDTNNSVFNSSFAPSASQLDTNEVDPVAEADVYIAYGRDAQAEEILKEALRAHPDRHPVRLKLLEIYAARKDQRAFETQAAEMYSLTRGAGDEWAQAAAMGVAIDPLNPLYAGAAGAPAPAPASEQEAGQQALLSRELDHTFGAPAPQHAAADDFSLDALADSAPTALPQLDEEPQPMDAQAKARDEHVLDFDLGGLSFEPVSSTEPIAMPAPAEAPATPDESGLEFTAAPSADAASGPASAHDLEFDVEPLSATETSTQDDTVKPAQSLAEQPFDLAFDMDFDAGNAGTPAPGASNDTGHAGDDGLALDMSLDTPSSDIDMADLAKEFDLPDVPAASTPHERAPADELKDPLFELDAMDFGLPAAHDMPAPTSEPAPADDEFALPDLPGTPAASNSTPQFDLSDIDLDLPEGATAEPLPEMEMAGAHEGEMSAAHMEMETKLDLAIAYQEIGDKDGARELLEEVIKGGSSEQVGKAQALRDKLA
jgi:pilus assembly protein FimV